MGRGGWAGAGPPCEGPAAPRRGVMAGSEARAGRGRGRTAARAAAAVLHHPVLCPGCFPGPRTARAHRTTTTPAHAPVQIAGILRGRPAADAPGSGHCATVLAVDAALEQGRQLIATGGQAGDGGIKIWRHESMAAGGAAAAGVAAAVAAPAAAAAGS